VCPQVERQRLPTERISLDLHGRGVSVLAS
jgi:hypothetical protein